MVHRDSPRKRDTGECARPPVCRPAAVSPQVWLPRRALAVPCSGLRSYLITWHCLVVSGVLALSPSSSCHRLTWGCWESCAGPPPPPAPIALSFVPSRGVQVDTGREWGCWPEHRRLLHRRPTHCEEASVSLWPVTFLRGRLRLCCRVVVQGAPACGFTRGLAWIRDPVNDVSPPPREGNPEKQESRGWNANTCSATD